MTKINNIIYIWIALSKFYRKSISENRLQLTVIKIKFNFSYIIIWNSLRIKDFFDHERTLRVIQICIKLLISIIIKNVFKRFIK